MTPSHSAEVSEADVPLCVDLDGTVLRTDLFWETLFALVGHHPAKLRFVFGWLFKGRAHMKRELAEHVALDVRWLPYNEPFVAWLRQQRSLGRTLVLATASDETLARRVAGHLDIFDEVFASDGSRNLKGSNKAACLHERFGNAFDYAGNSSSDWKIWRGCRRIIAVNTPWWLTRRLLKSGRLTESFQSPGDRITVWRRALRTHQWVKNVLIFLPLITAHKLLDRNRWIPSLICFLAFNLVASATYLGNDLADLAADRMHPRKKFRPIAAGDLGIPSAVSGSLALLVCGLALATLAGTAAPLLLLFYGATSFVYSISLKKIALLDVYVLSGLYTLRIVMGGVAGHVPLSGWFLSFSVFLFLSLGFAKRAAELHRVIVAHAQPQVPGRGYSATDFLPVMCFGIASAFAAALVLTLYFQSAAVQALYRYPQFLWAVFPLFLYWLTRIWLLAERGSLQEDPISFAMKDRTTWLLIALCAFILKLANW